MFHHSFRGFARPARIVIRVAHYGVVSELSGANFKALDHFREKRIFNIGNNDAERPAIVRRQVASVHVRDVPKAFDRRKHHAVGLAAHFAGLVQDIRNGCCGNACFFGYVTNG